MARKQFHMRVLALEPLVSIADFCAQTCGVSGTCVQGVGVGAYAKACRHRVQGNREQMLGGGAPVLTESTSRKRQPCDMCGANASKARTHGPGGTQLTITDAELTRLMTCAHPFVYWIRRTRLCPCKNASKPTSSLGLQGSAER